MTKICTQTNVAEIDNSAQTCEKFIDTDCIIHKDAIAYLSLPANSSTTEIINALVLSLTDARNRILTLEQI
jgi:hypothetical protein